MSLHDNHFSRTIKEASFRPVRDGRETHLRELQRLRDNTLLLLAPPDLGVSGKGEVLRCDR